MAQSDGLSREVIRKVRTDHSVVYRFEEFSFFDILVGGLGQKPMQNL